MRFQLKAACAHGHARRSHETAGNWTASWGPPHWFLSRLNAWLRFRFPLIHAFFEKCPCRERMLRCAHYGASCEASARFLENRTKRKSGRHVSATNQTGGWHERDLGSDPAKVGAASSVVLADWRVVIHRPHSCRPPADGVFRGDAASGSAHHRLPLLGADGERRDLGDAAACACAAR